MSTKIFLSQGKWLPSFALFGRGELVFHKPITSQHQSGSIKRVLLNPSYSSQSVLAQSLTKELLNLVKELNKKQANPFQIKISHLRSMMQSVVKAGEETTENYHNIIYLTLKYLGYVVSQQSKQNHIEIEDQIILRSWLADIHWIYYQKFKSSQILKSVQEEVQLLDLFKLGRYQQMVPLLRNMHLKADEKESASAKISVVLTLLLHKMSEQDNAYVGQSINQKGINRKKAIQNLKSKFNKSNPKIKAKGQIDNIQLIAEILFGNESSLQTLVQGSWPLFLVSHPNLDQLTNQDKRSELRAKVNRFIKTHKQYEKSTERDVSYLLGLMFDTDLHTIYQSLQAIIPPFYCHFIAYLIDLIAPNLSPNILVEDYFSEIMRNLLYHASQISFECLIYSIGALQQSNSNERKSQVYQPLLIHHLVVIDPNDMQELRQFLRKVSILQDFKLQTYVTYQLNSLIQNLLENGVISRQTLLVYAYCCIISRSYYNYEYNYQELLAYHLEEIYTSRKFDTQFLKEFQKFKDQLQKSNNIAMQIEMDKIEPLFDKFYLYRRLSTQQPTEGYYITFIQLMQKTYRSLRLLQLISDEVENLNTPLAQSEFQKYQKTVFLNSVKEFLIHYPGESSQPQKQLINMIFKLID